jgi:DNA-directed RNA polymerase subunit RPC12/RpoP
MNAEKDSKLSTRVFQCAECSHKFEHVTGALRCPECRGKTLVLVEGPSLRGGAGAGKGGCGGNCGSCGGGCHG